MRIDWDEGDMIFIDLTDKWDVMSDKDPDRRFVWYFPSHEARELYDLLGRVLGLDRPPAHTEKGE